MVRPTECRWLADPTQITDPGGNLFEPKISWTSSVSSLRPPDSSLITLMHFSTPDRFGAKFWSLTQTHTGPKLVIIECSFSQLMNVRFEGSKDRLID